MKSGRTSQTLRQADQFLMTKGCSSQESHFEEEMRGFYRPLCAEVREFWTIGKKYCVLA